MFSLLLVVEIFGLKVLGTARSTGRCELLQPFSRKLYSVCPSFAPADFFCACLIYLSSCHRRQPVSPRDGQPVTSAVNESQARGGSNTHSTISMARIISAAVTAVCLALLGASNGFVPSPSFSPVAVTSNPLWAAANTATADGGDVNGDDAESAPSSMSSAKNLDHEHSAAPTYDAKTTTSLSAYRSLHAESIKNPSKFWSRQAKELITWYKPFNPHAVMSGGLDHGDVRFFAGGKLNVASNAIDRHVDAGRGDDVAIVWEVS